MRRRACGHTSSAICALESCARRGFECAARPRRRSSRDWPTCSRACHLSNKARARFLDVRAVCLPQPSGAAYARERSSSRHASAQSCCNVRLGLGLRGMLDKTTLRPSPPAVLDSGRHPRERQVYRNRRVRSVSMQQLPRRCSPKSSARASSCSRAPDEQRTLVSDRPGQVSSDRFWASGSGESRPGSI